MSQSYSRLLNDKVLVEHFLVEVLKYDRKKAHRISSKIVDCELEIKNFNPRLATLDMENYRNSKYRSDADRHSLRERVIEELYNIDRIDDDKIKLGKGGAKPTSGIKHERKAFIVIGPPASGKSTISNRIADEHGAYIVDSDYAKRKLPEFHSHQFGAHLVHEESDRIVSSGFKGEHGTIESLFTRCVKEGSNIVMPKIGHDHSKIYTLANSLATMKEPYEVHLTLVNLDRRNATLRAVNRFKSTKRYVPLGLIFDGYGNDPIMTYYLSKSKYSAVFSSFGEVSTLESSPKCTDIQDNNPASFFTS